MSSLSSLPPSILAPVVAFGGSRSGVAPAVVQSVVGAVLAGGAGGRFSVGCCVGADAQVLAALVAAGAASRVRVFAAFGPGGAGSCSLSSVGGVAAAQRAGAAVAWWSGGAASVPLAARLARRSAACVASAQALVLFSPGAGSLAAAWPAAAAHQLPVLVVAPAPPPVGGLAWQVCRFGGVRCWLWQPPAVQLGLF